MKSDQNELLVVGIDVGTTGAKALVMSASGEVVGAGYQGYPLITGEGGIVEQDASLWYDASCTAVRQAASDVDTSRIRALSMSTQGASSLLVDEAGSPLGNAITWMDGRAAAEKHEIIAALGDETVYETTGWRTHQALDACKLKWIVKHQKDDYDRAAYYLSTLEYMNARLTGVCAVDPTNAAIRQLMDIQTLAYDDGILDAAGGDAAKLPQILPTGKLLETLTPQAAADLGLHADVRVYNGAHDQYCGLYGAGVSRSGELMLSAGTAWVTVGVTDQPLHTKSYMSPGPHIVPGKYGALASLPCSGAAFDWLRSGVISTDYADINAQAASRRDKCADLLFYPYLSGAAFPLWNENHRGAMLGLSLEHDKYDIALACMEGVVFQLMAALHEYPEVRSIKAMGGATKSKLWMDILAALCGCDLMIMSEKDTPCVGAALIAAAGEGCDYNSLVQKAASSALHPPASGEAKAFYQEKFARYRAMQNTLYGAGDNA